MQGVSRGEVLVGVTADFNAGQRVCRREVDRGNVGTRFLHALHSGVNSKGFEMDVVRQHD